MKKRLGRLILWMMGWKQVGEFPPLKKYVIIASPHTSNWDGLLLMAFGASCGMSLSWMGKDSLFKWPFGWFLRLMGGIPINRRLKENIVEKMREEFLSRDVFHLAIPPSGTRDFCDYWKSGFYFIAKRANVPIILSFLDYKNKEGGYGGCIEATGDIRSDMEKIRSVYAHVQGKFPNKVSKIRLRIEDSSEEKGDHRDRKDPAVSATS